MTPLQEGHRRLSRAAWGYQTCGSLTEYLYGVQSTYILAGSLLAGSRCGRIPAFRIDQTVHGLKTT